MTPKQFCETCEEQLEYNDDIDIAENNCDVFYDFVNRGESEFLICQYCTKNHLQDRYYCPRWQKRKSGCEKASCEPWNPKCPRQKEWMRSSKGQQGLKF